MRKRLSEMSGTADGEALQPIKDDPEPDAEPRSSQVEASRRSWVARPFTLWR